jgi:hypothetical protein
MDQVINNNQSIQFAMAKIEILSFFQSNPHTRDTLEGFSNRLFLDVELVKEIMDELVNLNILERYGSNGYAIYRLRISYSTLAEYVG